MALCFSCTGAIVQSKFEEIRKSNQATAKRLLESHLSSSSDDDNEVEMELKDGKRGKILESTFTTYTDQTGEAGVALATAGNSADTYTPS